MKVWHVLLVAIVTNTLFAWLVISLLMSFTRVATGNCPSQEWINNGWVNSAWFCR